jgi:hypothetical protein
MSHFVKRDEPIRVVVAQRWTKGTYQREFGGWTFPDIEYVPRVGAVPAHGIFHGPEGDVVINHGDYIRVYPESGLVGAQSWYSFVANYEEVLDVAT